MIATTYPGGLESIALTAAGLLMLVAGLLISLVVACAKLLFRRNVPIALPKIALWLSVGAFALFVISTGWIAVSEWMSGAGGQVLFARTFADWPLLALAGVLSGCVFLLKRSMRVA